MHKTSRIESIIVPEPFAKLCYLKFEFPIHMRIFCTYIFSEKLANLWFRHRPTICTSMHVRVIINARTNAQHTSELTGRKPPTLDARNYISAPKIWPSHNLKFKLNSNCYSIPLHTEEIWEKWAKKKWIYAGNITLKVDHFLTQILASRENINYSPNIILLAKSSVCGLGGLVRAEKENSAVNYLKLCCNYQNHKNSRENKGKFSYTHAISYVTNLPSFHQVPRYYHNLWRSLSRVWHCHKTLQTFDNTREIKKTLPCSQCFLHLPPVLKCPSWFIIVSQTH